MTTEPDTELSDPPTDIIFSLTVISEVPIAQLSAYSDGRSALSPTGMHQYDIYHASFVEDDWSARATMLDDAVNLALDKLDASGVGATELDNPGVLVRAFFSFGYGSETLNAALVSRLARCHATIWIDALG